MFTGTEYECIKNVLRVKVKLSICFNLARRHGGVLGEWRFSSTRSLTSALDEGEWSVSRPDRFTPRERAPGTDLDRRLGGPIVTKQIHYFSPFF
jgi:hypothetical protein